jgi:hypothetical protein
VTGQCPQEGLQLVAAQLPQPEPPSEVLPIFPEKADISRSTFFDPHCGQSTASFSSRLRKSTSKQARHFRHLNSKIGISLSPRTKCIPTHCTSADNSSDRPAAGRLEETHENVKAEAAQTHSLDTAADGKAAVATVPNSKHSGAKRHIGLDTGKAA